MVQQTDDLGGIRQRSHEVELHVGRTFRGGPGPDHLPGPCGAGRQPGQHVLGVAHRGRQADALDVPASEALNPGEDRQQVPAPVIRRKRMEFVNDHRADVLEEVGMVDLGRDQYGLQGLRGREQAVRRCGDDPAFLRLGRVPVPASHLSADELKVAIKPAFLVVQERLDRADVKDRQPGPRFRQHLRKHREECGLGLPSRSRGQDDEVRTAEVGADGQSLDGSQFPPAEGIDDVVLKSRMQSVKITHTSNSMSSTVWAWASRSVLVISPVLTVNW